VAAPELRGNASDAQVKRALARRRIVLTSPARWQPHPLRAGSSYRGENPQWSRDGTHLLITRIDSRGHNASIWLISSDGISTQAITPALQTYDWDENWGWVDWQVHYAWWQGPPQVKAREPGLEAGGVAYLPILATVEALGGMVEFTYENELCVTIPAQGHNTVPIPFNLLDDTFLHLHGREYMCAKQLAKRLGLSLTYTPGMVCLAKNGRQARIALHHDKVAEYRLREVMFHRGQTVRSPGSLRIIKQHGVYTIQFPNAMWNALKRYNPTFAIRRQDEFLPSIIRSYKFTASQIPAAVIGDFNGDGKRDVALIGYTNTDDILLVVCSSGRGYRVLEVEKSPLTNSKTEGFDMGEGKKEYGILDYLTFAVRGKRKSPFEPRMLVIRTDAFEYFYFDKASELYYYRHGLFHSYCTGD